jgi:hypothetical protein
MNGLDATVRFSLTLGEESGGIAILPQSVFETPTPVRMVYNKNVDFSTQSDHMTDYLIELSRIFRTVAK